MKYESLLIAHLHRIWDELVDAGCMTWDEMHDSLLDQITGSEDMSVDELDESVAVILGWDINNLTESQCREWRGIVDMAAREWISR